MFSIVVFCILLAAKHVFILENRITKHALALLKLHFFVIQYLYTKNKGGILCQLFHPYKNN